MGDFQTSGSGDEGIPSAHVSLEFHPDRDELLSARAGTPYHFVATKRDEFGDPVRGHWERKRLEPYPSDCYPRLTISGMSNAWIFRNKKYALERWLKGHGPRPPWV